MEKEYYFDCPKQVVFADPDAPGEWITGIAYKDEIICACCGGVFEIAEVVELADGVANPIYAYEDWINIASEITGGEMPAGLEISAEGKVIEVEPHETEEADEVEAYYFKLDNPNESVQAVFANTWVNGIAMPSF